MEELLKGFIEHIRDNGLVWVNHDECIEFDPIDKIVDDFIDTRGLNALRKNKKSSCVTK